MHNNKLIQLLKGFSARELNKFMKYVQSPFFNKHKDVLILYNYLKESAPDFESDNLEKTKILKHFKSHNISLSEKHYYHITSYLLELLCDFIAFLEQEKNIFIQTFHVDTHNLNRQKIHSSQNSMQFD